MTGWETIAVAAAEEHERRLKISGYEWQIRRGHDVEGFDNSAASLATTVQCAYCRRRRHDELKRCEGCGATEVLGRR